MILQIRAELTMIEHRITLSGNRKDAPRDPTGVMFSNRGLRSSETRFVGYD